MSATGSVHYRARPQLILLGVIVAVAACTPWRRSYLEHGVSRLTQDSVAARLGPPMSERALSDSQAVWHYVYTRSYVSGTGNAVTGGSKCREYILLFDRNKVLRSVTYQRC